MVFKFIRWLLFKLDPETAHTLVLKGLEYTRYILKEIALNRSFERIKLWNLEFGGRLGLAAGMDKNCVLGSLWSAFGFGFVEVGTITPVPQRGNPKPRLFRLEDRKALINRIGFNNLGVCKLKENLLKDPRIVPLGINIGKNRWTPLEKSYEDYVFVLKEVYGLGDYFVINISSPNTEGLRELQKDKYLEILLGEIWRFRKGKPYKPVLVKLAPEVEDLERIAKICENNDIDGVILTNTLKVEGGGLSGKPLFEISNRRIREWRSISDIPVMGVGGIFSMSDVDKKIKMGAKLTQVLTGFVYKGWNLFQP